MEKMFFDVRTAGRHLFEFLLYFSFFGFLFWERVPQKTITNWTGLVVWSIDRSFTLFGFSAFLANAASTTDLIF